MQALGPGWLFLPPGCLKKPSPRSQWSRGGAQSRSPRGGRGTLHRFPARHHRAPVPAPLRARSASRSPFLQADRPRALSPREHLCPESGRASSHRGPATRSPSLPARRPAPPRLNLPAPRPPLPPHPGPQRPRPSRQRGPDSPAPGAPGSRTRPMGSAHCARCERT